MNKVTLTLNIVPPTATHQAKKIVRVGGFSRLADTPRLQGAIATYTAALLNHPERPARPLSGPIVASFAFAFPWLGKHTKGMRSMGKVWKTTKPDCDNMAKTLLDVLATCGYIEKDEQVAVLRVEKHYQDAGGVYITLEELE